MRDKSTFDPFDAELLDEIKHNYTYGLQADQENRDAGDEDMRALSFNGPMPLAEQKARAGGMIDGTLISFRNSQTGS